MAITFWDGSNSLESITQTMTERMMKLIANGTFTADEKFELILVRLSVLIDYLNACISYDITAD